ncbi:hypothetical protein B0H16DRAFT_1715391 [Mycena metata]|uniref:Uncharacterized protein n=1 Tax=Mycena metata TaxID=1033252 RepID=A0AAD7NQT6_9AGAR|nr:hypothetical protein B0H16DRAFT_1715391 [Mycena metata]
MYQNPSIWWNIAYMDIETGVASEVIRPNLEIPKHHLSTSLAYPIGVSFCDMGFAALFLRDGELAAAKALFMECLLKFNYVSEEGVTYCLERMASLDSGMFSLEETLRWAWIYFAHSRRVKERVGTAHSLRCLGQIFLKHGDEETALSLFRVALEEFSVMGVHRWRADCMMRIAEIFEHHADVGKPPL